MTVRHFDVELTVSTRVKIDSKVIDQALTDDWRKQFYPLMTAEDVVEHIAFNLLQGRSLGSLDGFANFADRLASAHDTDWVDWTVTEKEGEKG